ncbi:MAG TPA: hypothetical protein VFS58_11375 [Steroidobacteraceae bacterium]|nr:hypothetical protein [Steroidobacteraceae bacterium]
MNQELIEQYVAGRLSEDHAQAFEDYCLANPDFARQVEYEQRLKAGIVEVARGTTAEFVRSNHPLHLRLAAAASVLLAFVAMFYFWNPGSPAAAPTIMAAVTDTTPRDGISLRLALVRGSDTAPALPAGMVRVEIVGLFDLGNQYSVALDRLEQNKKIDTIATLNDQHPSSPVSLEVMIDSKQLRSGLYSLRVRKQASGEEALDFGFVKF